MKKMLIALFVFALAMMITGNEVFGQSLAGEMSIDSVTAQRGDHIAVGLRLSGNTRDISGVSAPVRYSTADLEFDSISYINSFITADFVGVIDTFSYSDVIKISYLPTNYNQLPVLYSPNGLVATLFFTVKNDAGPGDSPIDSVNIIENLGGNIKQTNIQFSSTDGTTTYYPDVVAGNVAVLVPTGINDEINSALPSEYTLAQNYPNPFNPSTIIGFSLPTASDIKLEIFNVLGQKVETLANGRYSAGTHNFEFDASELTSGIFFYRLTHQKGVETKKMLLIK